MNARLVHITAAQPWGAERENSVERTAQNVHIACADFYLLLKQARTVDQALRIRELLNECVMALAAAEDAALMKADAVCCQPDFERGA